jgi:hypothetical protein
VVRKEEIDLLLLTGERVFAIEAKCFLPGYEPRETARYQAAVCKAMDQAKRKASNLAASRSALKSFLKDGKVSATLDLDSCPISPVVVLYHPLGAGTGDEECPVVDRITLSKFLGNEVPRPMVQTEFGWSYIGNPEPVYRTAAEADGMFLGYVADPPILRGYQKQVVEAFAELFSFEGTPTGIRACHFDIQPDAEEVSVYEQLTKRSE